MPANLLVIGLSLLGLLFGSFASVINERLYRGEKGILAGRSRCPKCKKTLRWIHLIPLLSYVLLGGHCAFCRKKISRKYPLLELTMAATFALTPLLPQAQTSNLSLAFYLFVAFISIIVAAYDLEHQEVADEIILPAAAVALAYQILIAKIPINDLLLGMAIPIGFFGMLFGMSRGKWIGGGDLRVGAFMGALLGWPQIMVGLFAAYLLGSVISLGGMATGQLHRKSRVPFAPFLLAGTYVALFRGQELLNWYLGF